MDPVIATAIDSLFDTISQAREVPPQPGEVLAAMAFSFILNMFIGLLYKQTYKGTRYSQDFVHTLVIIGTVTTILIMVVNGNSAVAFGMFAAFSMIRFRRNLGQSRDLGFVFFAMAAPGQAKTSTNNLIMNGYGTNHSVCNLVCVSTDTGHRAPDTGRQARTPGARRAWEDANPVSQFI